MILKLCAWWGSFHQKTFSKSHVLIYDVLRKNTNHDHSNLSITAANFIERGVGGRGTRIDTYMYLYVYTIRMYMFETSF